eukprot:Em0037g15a
MLIVEITRQVALFATMGIHNLPQLADAQGPGDEANLEVDEPHEDGCFLPKFSDALFELQKLSVLKRVHRVFRDCHKQNSTTACYPATTAYATSLYGPLLKESRKFIRLNRHAQPSFRECNGYTSGVLASTLLSGYHYTPWGVIPKPAYEHP